MDKIIALIDFSDVTRHVIDFAAKQAKAFNAELILLHSEPEAYEKLYRKIDDEERSRRAKMLKFEHSDLNSKSEELRTLGINSYALLIEGPEVETILAEVEKHKPSMVVLGNHHHSFFDSFFKGSVGEELVDKLTCPTVLIS